MKQFITKEGIRYLAKEKENYGTDWRGNTEVEINVKRKYVYITIYGKTNRIEKDYFFNEVVKYIGEDCISSMYSLLNAYGMMTA